MKKLLTILILLLTVALQGWAISFNTKANEVVISNTETVMASNWSSNLQIDANKFTYAKGGDVITVYYKDNNSGSIKLCSGASGWPTLDSSFDSGAPLDANANKFQYELTSDNASVIKANGLIVSGAKYTIDCVILTHNPEVVSTSTYEINWSGGDQPTITGFNNLEVGDYIRISVSNTNNGTQINFKRSWDENDSRIYSTTTEFHVTESADVTYIKENGIIFTGCDYTLNEVTIEKQPSALELMSGECRTLFSGNHETTWTKVCEKDASWGGLLAVGDQIKITVSAINSDETNHYVWITNSSGTAIDEGNAKPDVTAANTTYIISLTSDEVDAMRSGFAIWGQNVTVTKVELYKPLYALTTTATNGSISVKKGNNDENNRRFETVTNLTLTATADDYYSFSGWTVNGSDEGSKTTLNLSMDADKNVVATFAVSEMTSGETRTLFSGTVSPSYGEICALGSDWGALLAEGDQIKITVSEVLTGDYHYVWITNSSGTAIDDGNAKPDVTEANTYIITLTADEVTAMRSGFAIWGQNVTVTNVELYRPVSYTLTTDVTPTGSGTILVQTVVENVATDTEETSFASGTNLKLTANPAANYAFSKWTVGGTDYDTNPYEFTITEAVTATVTFVPSITKDSFSAMSGTYSENVLSASGSIQAYIGPGSTISGTRFNVTTSAASKLRVEVYYVGDTSDPTVYETISSGDAAKDSYELKLDKTKMIEKIQISNQSDSDVTFSSISLGQDDDTTGTITTDDMPIGWSSTYTPGTKTVAFEGAADSWPARGWNVGGTTYNGKSITVTFTSEPALGNGVITLKMEYYDAHGALKTASNVNTGNTIELEVPDGAQAVKRAYLTVASTGTFVLSEITATTIVKYTLTKNATNGAIRVVKSNGDVTTDTEIKAGEVLKLWAIGDDGYDFTEWTIGGSTSTANPYTLTMDAAKEVTATFAEAPTDANALWSGSKAINWNTVEIAASNFESANTGDKIIINVDYVGDDDWPKVVLRKNASNPLSGAEDTQLSSSMTSVTYYINESMLADLKQYGLFVSGAGYRLKSVKLEADDDPTTVWTGLVAGSTNFDTNDVLNTNNEKILAGVEAKDTIYIYTTGVASGANYQLQYKMGSGWTWTELISDTSVPEIIKYAATAELAPLIATRGLVISGSGYSINKISLHKFKETPLTAGETRNLYTSSGDVIDWNQICEKGASYGALLQAGDVFQITVSALTSGTDNHQVVLRGGSHNEGTSVKATGMVEIVVTADILSNYTSGFSITGTGVTVSKVDLFRPKAVSRTERMMNESEVVMDGSNGATVNSGKFGNASAYDVLRVYFTNTSGATSTSAEEAKMHLILKYNGESDNWDYIKEMRFAGSETQFEIPLTQSVLALLKNNGLQVTGEKFTFKSVSLFTASALGPDTKKNSDEEKKDDEKKGDEEAIIDEETGEADLTELSAQDATKTTLTQNEDGSITMTTTEAYCAAQIWFNNPETVTGNVLKVELAESSVNVTVTVKYTDGTESQMSANTMVAKARGVTRAVSSGSTIEVPLESGKEVQNIEVKNNVAGTITIKKMQVTTVNVFTNGVANLSMLKPQSNATYDTAAHTLATTKGWTGATISPVANENVSGKELLIEFADASKVKVAVKYRTDVEGPSTIMEKAAKAVRLALDNSKNIQEISIQPTEAAIVTFTKIAVNSEETDDGSLKPGKTITLWESATGETLAWNEVAKQDASVGETLKEYDELLITVSGVTEGCDWPKVFIRDASSDQAGNEVLLNDIASFPYTVRIVLTGEMAQQLKKGFSICGDGVTVTKLQVYRPEAPKTGDIHLADLNYGYNSSYDKGTHTITTTARWAARGWEIGDKRYNDKNLITVKFEPVDFPVTLKMEYTTGLQTAQATSVGVPAGRTELLLEIPSGISKLNRVYIIYENPGSVKLTEASVTYQDNLKLSTAIKAFEADGVIRDGRYDTDGWYNLRGMRIPEPKTSGVYIHGGKKVVIY